MDIHEIRKRNLVKLLGARRKGACAEKWDMAPAHLSQVLSDKTAKNLGDDVARRIEQKEGLPRGWLDTLQMPAFSREGDAEGLSSNVAGERIEVQTRSVPVVGKAMLGPDGYFDAMEYPVGHGEGTLNVVSRDENAYGLRVVGHSMEPRIKHNEFVLVEPNQAYVAGDEVLVKTIGGQAMIKCFAYSRDGEYRFDSINAEYAPVMLDEADVEFIHYVGAIVKSSMFVVAE